MTLRPVVGVGQARGAGSPPPTGGDFAHRILTNYLVNSPIATARAFAITPKMLAPYSDRVRAISTKIGEVITDSSLKIGAKLALTIMRGQVKFLVEGSDATALLRPAIEMFNEYLGRSTQGEIPGHLPKSQEGLKTLGAIERELSAKYNLKAESATPLDELERHAKALIVVSSWIVMMQERLAAGETDADQAEDLDGRATPAPLPARPRGPVPAPARAAAQGAGDELDPEPTQIAFDPRRGLQGPIAPRAAVRAAVEDPAVAGLGDSFAAPHLPSPEEEALDRAIRLEMSTLESLARTLELSRTRRSELDRGIQIAEQRMHGGMARAGELREELSTTESDVADARADLETAEGRLRAAEGELESPRREVEAQARRVSLAVERATRDLEVLLTSSHAGLRAEFARIIAGLNDEIGTAVTATDGTLSPLRLSLGALGPGISRSASQSGVTFPILEGEIVSAGDAGAQRVSPLVSSSRGFADLDLIEQVFSPLDPTSPGYVGLQIMDTLGTVSARMRAGANFVAAQVSAGAQASVERRLEGKRERMASARAHLESLERARDELQREHRERATEADRAGEEIALLREELNVLPSSDTLAGEFGRTLGVVRARIGAVAERVGTEEFIAVKRRVVAGLEARATGGVVAAVLRPAAPVGADEIEVEVVVEKGLVPPPAVAAAGPGAEPAAPRGRATPPPPPADDLDLDHLAGADPFRTVARRVPPPPAAAPAPRPVTPPPARRPATPAPAAAPARPATPPPTPALKPLVRRDEHGKDIDMKDAFTTIGVWLNDGARFEGDPYFDIVILAVEEVLENHYVGELEAQTMNDHPDKLAALRALVAQVQDSGASA